LAKRIFVGNLPYEADETQLRAWFEGAGFPAQTVTIAVDRLSGHPRGFGFIEVSDKHAVRCIRSCNGQEFLGRTLIINEASAAHDGWLTSGLHLSSRALNRV
jgi:RNA recognition motif-containing protein